MAVKEAVGVAGLDKQGGDSGLTCGLDHAGAAEVVGEEIVEGLHLFRSDQGDGAVRGRAEFGKASGEPSPASTMGTSMAPAVESV